MRTNALRPVLAPLLAAATLTLSLSACGSADEAATKVNDAQQQVEQQAEDVKAKAESLKDEAADFQAQAQKIADQVKSGEISKGQGEARLRKLIKKQADQVTAASDADADATAK